MNQSEAKITAWREKMRRVMPGREEVIAELEEHLREETAQRIAEGASEEEAFARSVAQLGDDVAIAREFERAGGAWLPASRPIAVVLTVMTAAVVLVLCLLGMSYKGGIMNLLLVLHAGIIGTGYLVVLGTGLVGACAIVTQWRRKLSAGERSEIRRVMFRLNVASAILVPTGIVLGMFYAAETWGRAWSWAPVELGALLVLGTTFVSLVAQSIGALAERVVSYLAVLGFFAVQYGWWGVKAATPIVPVTCLCAALFATQVALVALNWRRPERAAS